MDCLYLTCGVQIIVTVVELHSSAILADKLWTFDVVPPIRQYEPFINGSLPLMNVPPIGQWGVH